MPRHTRKQLQHSHLSLAAKIWPGRLSGGPNLDSRYTREEQTGGAMHTSIQNGLRQSVTDERRSSARKSLAVSGRIVWRDARGTTRFASVVTRDVNDEGVFVECVNGTPIPLYRLTHLQLDVAAAAVRYELPPSLRRGKVLAAVCRVAPSEPRTGRPQGYALRLLIEPERRVGRPGFRQSVMIPRLETPADPMIATA